MSPSQTTKRPRRETTNVDRATLEQRFEDSTGRPAKTFVLEAHAGDDPERFLTRLAASGRMHPTDDAHLHVLDPGDLEFWVDHLDKRFWSFHTWSPAHQARRYLKDQVERRRDLDWTWLPSGHLSQVWPSARPKLLSCDFRGERFLPEGSPARHLQIKILGENTDELINLIAAREEYASAVSVDQVAVHAEDPAFGMVDEAVNRTGRFIATGDSFALHQEFVRGVVKRYRRLVETVERYLVKWEELDNGGASMDGAPITIQLSRPIQDLDAFLAQLFSCREPFRLWGIPETSDDTAEVDAVDLHVGQRLRFEVGRSWIRVFLYEGGCGNSIARLASNLQHRYDASLTLVRDDLAAALRAGSLT
jgi:hypothetical protein